MPLNEEYFFPCPYCGASNSLSVDFTAGSHQKMVTDCEICCRPIVIKLELDEDEIINFEAEPE